MIINQNSIKSNDSSLKENWKKHGAELFPCASGVQAPYVGQADSTFIASKEHHDLHPTPTNLSDTSFIADELPAQKSKKKSPQKTRLLGDVVDPFAHTSVASLQELLPQTRLYLPDVGKKRGKKQKQQKMKEISSGMSFSQDVMAFRCSHLIDYDEETINKTVYQGSRSRRQKRRDQPSPTGFPPKHTLCHLNEHEQNKLVHKPKAFVEIDKQMKHEFEEILYSVAKSTRPFRSSVGKFEQSEKSAEDSPEWDEYVLALLSQSTARWLSDELSSGPEQTRLVNFLKNRYEKMENKEDDESASATQLKDETHKRENSKFGEELDKVLTDANFEPHYSPSFTLPPAVGKKKFTTDNIFQQEMMAGAFPVRTGRAPRKSIVLDTNSHLKFEKKLQANFPEDPNKWSKGKNQKAAKLPGKVVKGLQRWNELPALLQDDTYVPSFQTFEKPKKTLREIELMSAHKTREDNNILRIGEEWRTKWMLEKRWQTASTEELIRGMKDINDHVRLAAVAACNKAAELRQRRRAEQGFVLRPDKASLDAEKMKKELEPELLDCISNLLDDSCKQVQLTAAVTLCSLDISEPKAVEILKDCVQNGNDIERWLSAQCLALSGHSADYIITELLSQTSSTDLVRQEQAAVLLWKLSHHSSLVHSVVAELLNSSSCHDRLVACRLLPRLKGSLNKDIAQKLSYMMWNDWEKSVRTAAAQALGRTGNGKLVHDALLKRLQEDNERVKTDALRKLANLGIMTVHLLPAFLSCFKSEFVSVRLEVATASGAINTPDDRIVAALVDLASEDHSWKVKAHSINALGKIGKVTDGVIEMLAWSMRYSKEAAVRAEACNAVAKLGLKDRRALSVLQDRLIVETDEIVRIEAERALKSLEVEFTGDLEMLNAIQSEVKRLCKKDNVISCILQRDKQEDYNRDFERLIAADVKTPLSCKESAHASERSVKSSEGWNPILAGFRARSALSEPSPPMVMRMERSRLPVDLNSATSEGSERTKSELDSYPDSMRSRSTTVDETDAVDGENYPVITIDQKDDSAENIS
ncbi:HEAT repeat-containing protein 4-like [Dendronephthya gigantea]|uniref:HEAT repeat-containing protein 4-like n=1 Tax=Dendronephthya gigantea TaxID=151771 RepID=UPI00106D09FB|nr:HEAT repeat-containing protein 4-like [Dendronephthya gigantea]